MSKRIAAALCGILAALAMVVIAPASPASACVTGCGGSGIVISPNGWDLGDYPQNTVVAVSWYVENDGTEPVELAFVPGATGCAKKVSPYVSPSSLILKPGVRAVTTYVSSACVGSGTVYLSAGGAQAWQSIGFYA